MPTSPTEETDPTHNKANLTDVKVTAFGCTETQIGVTTKPKLQPTQALQLELGTNETMFAINPRFETRIGDERNYVCNQRRRAEETKNQDPTRKQIWDRAKYTRLS